MTRHYLLSTALTIMLGVGGLSLAGAAESTQPALTKKTLVAAIASAETPQDHQRIANYYKAEAGRMLAEAKEHDELAVAYAKSPNAGAKHPMSGQTAEHCKFLPKPPARLRKSPKSWPNCTRRWPSRVSSGSDVKLRLSE